MANSIFKVDMIAEVVNANLGNEIQLLALADVKPTEAKTGDTITVPKVSYIGNAEVVAEKTPIPVKDFVTGTEKVEIHKVGIGLSFSEEEVLNSYIDVNMEAEKQLTASIANALEAEMFGVLKGIDGAMAHEVTGGQLATVDIADALVKFGEKLNEAMYVIVSPAMYAQLRHDDNFVANANHAGVVANAGQIFGCNVIVSNSVEATEAFIIKQGAVGMYLKQDLLLEADKNLSTQEHMLYATKHFGVHLKDAAKAIKITTA